MCINFNYIKNCYSTWNQRSEIRDQIKRYKKPHYSPHKFHYMNLFNLARRSDRTVDETANALRQRRLRTVSLILRLPYRAPLPFSPPTELDNHCHSPPIVQIIPDPCDDTNTETIVKKRRSIREHHRLKMKTTSAGVISN